jgi:drug/metabolite transporter (DMT)-like permease
MTLPLYLILPLVSAFLYSVASLVMRRATEQGVGPWRVVFVANWVTGLMALFILFLPGGEIELSSVLKAVLCGVLFCGGQILTFLALGRGDVSVITPVMGTKVILVAFFTVLLIGESIPVKWWVAVFLTALATLLLARKREGAPARAKGTASAVQLAFASAIVFALIDVLIQKWAPAIGFSRFVPMMFFSTAVASIGVVPMFRGRLLAISGTSWRWLLTGSLLIGTQVLLLAYSLSQFGHATAVNVVYSSRAVWAVLLVWFVGHWFENRESQEHGNAIMAQRLGGAGLIVSAIWLILSGK